MQKLAKISVILAKISDRLMIKNLRILTFILAFISYINFINI